MGDPDIFLQITRLIPGGVVVNRDSTDVAPGKQGAYVLLLHLVDPVQFSRRGISEAVLSGWHAYAGSARGNGGIRARLTRHFRADKKVHWHVDELTIMAAEMVALALPGGSECPIVERLTGSGLFETALSGFGSSDCVRCEAHLLKPAQRSAR